MLRYAIERLLETQRRSFLKKIVEQFGWLHH
jgi:hypothetical protein